jgi:hypothetical protein
MILEVQAGRVVPGWSPGWPRGVGHGLPMQCGRHQQELAACVIDGKTEAEMDAVVAAAPPLSDEARTRLGYLFGRGESTQRLGRVSWILTEDRLSRLS